MSNPCENLQLHFWAALDGELDLNRSAELAAHLGACANCRVAAREAVIVHRRLHEVAKPVQKSAIVPELKPTPAEENSAAPKQNFAGPSRRILVLDWRAWVAAASIVLGLTIYLYHNYGPDRSDLVKLATTVSLESFSGNVRVITEYLDTKEPAQKGRPLSANDGIEIYGVGQAVIRYNDGTRVTLNSQNVARIYMRHLKDFTPTKLRRGMGKRITLEAGSIEAEVMPQSSDNPMFFSTPQVEAMIVGTRLKISVTPDSTRLDVDEGKVELARRKDNASVAVSTKEYVVAPWEGALMVKKLN